MSPQNNTNSQQWSCRTHDDVCCDNGLKFRRVTTSSSVDERFKKQIKNRVKNIGVIDLDSAAVKNKLQINELEKALIEMRDQKKIGEMAGASFKAWID